MYSAQMCAEGPMLFKMPRLQTMSPVLLTGNTETKRADYTFS